MTHIPVGLATKLGVAVSTLLGSATVIQAFLDGDHTETTIATLAGLIVTVYKIMDGRYNQATAGIVDSPAATAGIVDNPATPTFNESTGDFLSPPPDEDNSVLQATDGDADALVIPESDG